MSDTNNTNDQSNEQSNVTTNVFDYIYGLFNSGSKLLQTSSDSITIQQKANIASSYNIGGNIKITAKLPISDVNDCPNYCQELLKDKQRFNNILDKFFEFLHSDDFITNVDNVSFNQSNINANSLITNIPNNISIKDHLAMSVKNKQSFHMWNLNYNRNLDTNLINTIASHFVTRFNKLVHYIITNNIDKPNDTVKQLVKDIFMNNKGTIYSYSHFTLILPALVNYLCTKGVNTVDEHALRYVGYVENDVKLLPNVTNDFNTERKYNIPLSDKDEIARSLPVKPCEYMLKDNSTNKFLVRIGEYNYPLTQFMMTNKWTVNTTNTFSNIDLDMLNGITLGVNNKLYPKKEGFISKLFKSSNKESFDNVTFVNDLYLYDKDGIKNDIYMTTLWVDPVIDKYKVSKKEVKRRLTFDEFTPVDYVTVPNCRYIDSKSNHCDGCSKYKWNFWKARCECVSDCDDWFTDRAHVSTTGDSAITDISRNIPVTFDGDTYSKPLDQNNNVWAGEEKIFDGCNECTRNGLKCKQCYCTHNEHTQAYYMNVDTLRRYAPAPKENKSDNVDGLINANKYCICDADGNNCKTFTHDQAKFFINQSPPSYTIGANGGCAWVSDSENVFKTKYKDYFLSDANPLYLINSIDMYMGEFNQFNEDIKNINTLITYHSVNSILFFDDDVFNDWINLITTSKALQCIINDINATLRKQPALFILGMIYNNMKQFIIDKVQTSKTFVELPIGPPLLKIKSEYVLENQLYHGTVSVTNVDENYKSYDKTKVFSPIINKIKVSDDSRKNINANYLDKLVNELNDNCVLDLSDKDTKQVVIGITIPTQGCQLFEILDKTIDNTSMNKVIDGNNIINLLKRYTTNDVKIETFTYDELKSLTTDSKQLPPLICLSFTPFDEKLAAGFTCGESVNVTTFRVDISNKTLIININTLSDDTDNKLYVYVTNKDKCNGKYILSNKFNTVTDKNNINNKFLLMNYTITDSNTMPDCLMFLS